METDTTTQGQTPAQAANSARLLFDDGLSVGEIAEELGIPIADVMQVIPLATLACGHNILITPAQSAAGQAYHCGQFRGITRLPGEAGPDVAMLAALTDRQADLLGAKFRSGYAAVALLKDDAGYRSPEWDGLDALWDEMWELARDSAAASAAAHERETAPELIANARRGNHLDAIARAEQLLAAERTAAGAL